jgi:RNA polymerase sigma-70 factor, ECF subfamily
MNLQGLGPASGRRDGDGHATPLRDVVQLHGKSLRRMARGLTRNCSDADDLLQDALERALRQAPDLSVEELRRWLPRVMRNRFIDCRRKLRAQHHEHVLASHSPEPSADQPDETAEQSQRVHIERLSAAVELLDAPFRRVLELHVLESPMSVIASELGISRATVGTRLFRARKKLRSMLTGEGLPDEQARVRSS